VRPFYSQVKNKNPVLSLPWYDYFPGRLAATFCFEDAHVVAATRGHTGGHFITPKAWAACLAQLATAPYWWLAILRLLGVSYYHDSF